tara:strand:- start:19951 stop:20961 length:1011 start_codon:yes stop_codon:yes gene_type:complete
MNIFQQLGLPEFHRKLSNKVTQLVKHYDEVVAKHKEGKIFLTQLKRDGVCSLTVVCSGDVKIFSRTGNAFTNTSELVAKIKLLNLPDGVYMGEMWVPKSVCSLEQLSGVVNPNRTKALSHEYSMLPHMLRMSWFDMISLKEFKEGYSPQKFANRHISLTLNFTEALAEINLLVHPDIDVLKCVTAKTEADIDDQLEFLVSGGEEGLIIADPEADWEAGHKGWRKMKKVRGVDYDLLCIGYGEGTGKYKGKVANLVFQWKGEVTIKCMLGKGWTHKMAEDMFEVINYADNVGMEAYTHVDSPIGKIFQVYALEESSKGKLRLPKVGEQRFDKGESDV